MHTGYDLSKLERQSLATWGQFLDSVKAEVLAATRRQLLYMLQSPETWVPGSLTKVDRMSGQLTVSFVVDLSAPGAMLTRGDAEEGSWLLKDLQRMRDQLRDEGDFGNGVRS